jgi:coenzyme PQQ precursor peptide PqqA
MTWETPTFVELKMDAEINSYQEDSDREQDDRF